MVYDYVSLMPPYCVTFTNHNQGEPPVSESSKRMFTLPCVHIESLVSQLTFP